MKLALTCEHGGNQVPKHHEYLFNANPEVLNTHRAYDLGALDLFKRLKPLAHFSKSSQTSRLMIELNRSLLHPQLFSEFSKNLSVSEKLRLLEDIYRPYRNSVEKWIGVQIEAGEDVVHISIHSFTPKLNHEERSCDIGWLYDPKRTAEKTLCVQLKALLLEADPQLNVRFNYPYLGTADGFTTYLRKTFPKHYIGIELEVNQKFFIKNVMDAKIKAALFSAISKISRIPIHN
jgi:predicted N-formylglutamate amidohydrolase